MGIRMYQEIGLKPEAEAFLEKFGNKIPKSTCPKCGQILSYGLDSIIYKHDDSFYGDGPNLREIKLSNGKIAKEIVQAEPWSSGPVTFFCLEVDGVRMFEWTDNEIQENL